MGNEPRDPFKGMKEMAITMHELYTSYTEAGFTKDQAMEIIVAMICETIRMTLETE